MGRILKNPTTTVADSAHVKYDIHSLLSSPHRDFLIRNNGQQVKIDSLKGKKLFLYFLATQHCPWVRLEEVYYEISPKGDFEVILVTADEDEESFKNHFYETWLAIPLCDAQHSHLYELFHVKDCPHLVILDETGKVITEDGVYFILKYGAEAYPFTLARIQELKDQEEEARRNPSLRSLLVSHSRDFVISSNGNKIPVSDLEGKTVGLYFWGSGCVYSVPEFEDFTPLLKVYEKLKANGENFEIVLIPLESNEELFNEALESMPWLSLPFLDATCTKLYWDFEIPPIYTLVIIGPDGKILNTNVLNAIRLHGIGAYPFTPEKIAELERIMMGEEVARTIGLILPSDNYCYWLTGKDGEQIPVSELEGNNILLFFSSHRSPSCRAFLPKLIDAYHKIKAKDKAFDVIFVSMDMDQASFDEHFAEMPWLAIPHFNLKKPFLTSKFEVCDSDIPMLVAIGSNGLMVTKEARDLVELYGADAYPFTEERIKEIEAENEEAAKGWLEKLTHETHKHELVLMRCSIYYCDSCGDEGHIWSYYCEECDFDLHPKCALEDKVSKDDAKEEE